MAAGVTKPTLVSFRRFMRFLGALVVLSGVWLLTTADSTSPTPPSQSSPPASPSPAETPSPSPSPSPSPIPTNAFLSLDVTQGPPTTVINVSGGQFLPNEQTTLYWDTANHVAGSATADGGGSFNTRVKPFAGDGPGVHKLCASVSPNPCANFTIVSATPSPDATPSPPESPSPLESPSPEESPSLVASPARITPSLSGFDVISRPPFVFLPIFGFGAILLALAYWAFSVIRRPRRPGLLPSAAVVHRATRPDYSAAFGAPPSTPAQPPEPSAWNEPVPHTPQPIAPPAAPQPVPPAVPPPVSAPAVEWGAPVEWGTGRSEWGIPEPPSPDEPEVPQPGD